MHIQNVDIYSKPHNSSSGGGGGAGYRSSVNGSDLPGDLNVTSITAHTGHIDDLSGKTLNYNEGTFLYLYAEDGTINKLRGDLLDYKEGYFGYLEADEIRCNGSLTTKDLHAETAWITELNSKYITTEYLNVTKQAHFFELVIDKIKSVGGTLILTQANSVLDYVKPMHRIDSDPANDVEVTADSADCDYFKCFWNAEEKDGREMRNDWEQYDQAICMSFNNVSEGINYDVSNKYYWRLVDSKFPQSYLNFSTGEEVTFDNSDTSAKEAAKERTSKNSVNINTPRIVYYLNDTETIVNTGWNTQPQKIKSFEVEDNENTEYIYKRFATPQVFVQDSNNPSFWNAVNTDDYTGPSGSSWSDNPQGATKAMPYEYVAVRIKKYNSNNVLVWEKFSTPSLFEEFTGAEWSQTSGGSSSVTQGTMSTTNTVFGIQMLPIANTTLSSIVPNTFMVDCSNARLNIGVYYTNGKSEWFPAPDNRKSHYECALNADSPIEAVVITNADELNWHLVNSIGLSNSDYDGNQDARTADFIPDHAVSAPTAGDNIVQLGYRWQDDNDTNEKGRGNAIIIAAYKTPDVGTGSGRADDLNDKKIVPPSYAQYEYIGTITGKEYELAQYRKTYMDATKSVFRGDFYTAGDTSIVDMIQQGAADFYWDFWAYSNVGPSDSPPAPMYPDGTTWSKGTQGGTSWMYLGSSTQPVTINQGETEAQAKQRVEFGPDGTTGLKYDDYNWVRIPGGTGTPGGHWINAYKISPSATTAPAVPNNNGVAQQLPYDGWTSTPPDNLPMGQYIWFCQAFLNSNNVLEPWQEPAIRLTGEDGDDMESIYTRNDGYSVSDTDPYSPKPPLYDRDTGQPVTDFNDWHGWGVDEDQVSTYWTDQPEGVGDPTTYDQWGNPCKRYEYISQRYKVGGVWSAYTKPVLWSNWGEKGRDGDGYEYIFKTERNIRSTWSGQDNPANWDINSSTDKNGNTFDDDEYLGPPSQLWDDDPIDLNDDDKRFEYCSMRKKVAGNWMPFSTPALWAHWSEPGGQGPTGPQGPQGVGGQSATGYSLIDYGSQAKYGLTISGDRPEDQYCAMSFALNFKCKVYKTTGDTPQALTLSELHNTEGLDVYVRMSQSKTPQQNSVRWYRFKTTQDGSENTVLTYYFDDMTSGQQWSQQQMENWLQNNNNEYYFIISLMPSSTSDYITLSDSRTSNVKATITIPFLINTDSQEASIKRDINGNAAYVNLVTNVNTRFGETTNSINQIISDVNGITTQVTDLATDVDGLENGLAGVQGRIDVQSDRIDSVVTDISNIEASIDVQSSVTIDLTGLNASTFYPVSISLQRNRLGFQRIKISRWLDSSMGVPYYAEHQNGFVVELDFQTIGSGYGTNYHPEESGTDKYSRDINHRFIITYNKQYADGDIVGNITQNTYGSYHWDVDGDGDIMPSTQSQSYDPKRWSDEIVYVRGGSKYLVETDFSDAFIAIWPSGYSWNSPSLSLPTLTSITIPVQDTMSRSEITQTTRSISLAVVEQNAATKEQLSRTGIDIANQTINLQAGKVNFLKTNGDPNPYISINSSGELIATGNLTSVDNSMMNKININAKQGYIQMLGPSVVYENGNPGSGAEQKELYKVQFERDPDSNTRIASQYLLSKYNIIQVDPVQGIYMSEYSSAWPTISDTPKERIILDNEGAYYKSYYNSEVTTFASWKNIIAEHNVWRYSGTSSSNVNINFNYATVQHPTNTSQYSYTSEPLIFDLYGTFIYWAQYSDAIWYVPDPARYVGKKFIIKCYGSYGGFKLHTGLNTNRWFISRNNSDTAYEYSLGQKSCTFISDGTFWICINEA